MCLRIHRAIKMGLLLWRRNWGFWRGDKWKCKGIMGIVIGVGGFSRGSLLGSVGGVAICSVSNVWQRSSIEKIWVWKSLTKVGEGIVLFVRALVGVRGAGIGLIRRKERGKGMVLEGAALIVRSLEGRGCSFG